MSRLAQPWLPWLAGLAGLFLGSFLNVLARSLAGGPSPWLRRSACPHCGQRLAWGDMLPVISFFFLRGRCRYCRHRLSPLYPLGEAACGLLAGLSLARYGPGPAGWACLAFCLVLLLISLVDIQAGIVPDVVVLPAAAAALAAAPWLPGPGLLDSLVGGLALAGSLWAVALIYRGLRGREGLGLGDVKLGGLLGAYLGFGGAGLALTLAAVGGLVFYLGLWAAGRVDWRQPLPFAPFMGLGGVVVALAGSFPLDWLMGVSGA